MQGSAVTAAKRWSEGRSTDSGQSAGLRSAGHTSKRYDTRRDGGGSAASSCPYPYRSCRDRPPVRQGQRDHVRSGFGDLAGSLIPAQFYRITERIIFATRAQRALRPVILGT